MKAREERLQRQKELKKQNLESVERRLKRSGSSKEERLLREFEDVKETFGIELALAAQNYIIEILRKQNEL